MVDKYWFLQSKKIPPARFGNQKLERNGNKKYVFF